VNAVANSVNINTNSGWELERAVGLQVLSQLQLASRRNLGIVTIISVSASGRFANTIGVGFNSGNMGANMHSMNGNSHGGFHSNNSINGSPPSSSLYSPPDKPGAGSAESFLAPTRALLREVLGGHGSAVGHGRTAYELRQFFESADVDGNGCLSADELLVVLSNLGLPTDQSMVQAMMDIADTVIYLWVGVCVHLLR
jgi:hypothetical protein